MPARRCPPAANAPTAFSYGGVDGVGVLHVINGEHFAGAERVQDTLAQRLPGLGFRVGFVALRKGRFGDARRTIGTRLVEAPMASRLDLRAVSAVVDEYRRGGYHLLHAHTPRSAMVAAIASRRTGAPLVYHVHSPAARDSGRAWRNWINDKVERLAMRRAAVLIPVCKALRDELLARRIDPARVQCVPNGVPGFAGAEPRRRPSAVWTLGMVALFRPRKGAEVLIEALAHLKRHGGAARLRMIGPCESPAYEGRLLALARSLDVADSIQWRGFREDIAAELRGIDLLTLPSLYGEGLPMVVLEAMAAAVPVVATDCEGVSQAVVDGQTGRLVPAGDSRAVAAAAAQIMSGRLDYEALSRASQERHAAEFSDIRMAERVASIYERVLGVAAQRVVSAGSPDARAG